MSLRRLLFAVPAAVLVLSLYAGLSTHVTPAGQPPLAYMDLDALRRDFNLASGSTRLIVLLSPT